MRAKCDCGQQEQSSDGRFHETFALASPVKVSEHSAALAVRNAPAAIFFSSLCSCLAAELAVPIDAAVVGRMSATTRRKVAGW